MELGWDWDWGTVVDGIEIGNRIGNRYRIRIRMDRGAGFETVFELGIGIGKRIDIGNRQGL